MGKRVCGFVVAGGAAMLLSVSASHAAVATFEGAPGTADAYTGVAGDGWQGGWQLTGSTATATVSNAAPLVPGANNYLQVTNTSSTAATLARQLSTTEKVYETPFTVSFDLRVDDLLINGGGDGGISIGLNRYPGTTGGNASMQIRAAFLGGKAQWLISHGTDAGDDTGYYEVRSDIDFSQDTLYRFVIDLDPTTSTYDVSINGADIDAVAVGTPPAGYTFGERFNFRANAGDAALQSWFAAGIQSDGTEGDVSFSLDNLRVVPEPSSLGIAAVTVAALALRRRA